jgi:hypothetical protein
MKFGLHPKRLTLDTPIQPLFKTLNGSLFQLLVHEWDYKINRGIETLKALTNI